MTLTVHTWKGEGKRWGFKGPLKAQLFGGNVGHAALELTWPANEEGDALANYYGNVEGMNISKRTENTTERQPDGSHQKVVYFAYFSWWPGNGPQGHAIQSFQEDRGREWDNEPEPEMNPALAKKYGLDSLSDDNATEVKGALRRTKTIKKIKKIEHPGLKKDINQDKAYQQLQMDMAPLQQKYNEFVEKQKEGMAEIAQAKVEGRAVNEDLIITDVELAEFDTLKVEVARLNKMLALCEADFNERHSSIGKTPDTSVQLPTKMTSNGQDIALRTESILNAMSNIASSMDEYKFVKNNCSTTVANIITAGVDKTLKGQMDKMKFDLRNKSQAKIHTPTSVNKLSKDMQSVLAKINKLSTSNVDACKQYKNKYQALKQKHEMPEQGPIDKNYAADDEANDFDDGYDSTSEAEIRPYL